jgi:hypothetical protein
VVGSRGHSFGPIKRFAEYPDRPEFAVRGAGGDAKNRGVNALNCERWAKTLVTKFHGADDDDESTREKNGV